MEHHEIDHAIGWFDSKDGLGKIYATIASEEKSFENGQILVATEASAYELHRVKFIPIKLRTNTNRTVLGQAILKNEGDEMMDVNAVIGYEYDVIWNFGNYDGIARSINTSAFIDKKDPIKFFWGIQKTDHVLASKSVGTRLAPGTALNVTLYGNYTINEGPYKADLLIRWADNTTSRKRPISVSTVS